MSLNNGEEITGAKKELSAESVSSGTNDQSFSLELVSEGERFVKCVNPGDLAEQKGRLREESRCGEN